MAKDEGTVELAGVEGFKSDLYFTYWLDDPSLIIRYMQDKDSCWEDWKSRLEGRVPSDGGPPTKHVIGAIWHNCATCALQLERGFSMPGHYHLEQARHVVTLCSLSCLMIFLSWTQALRALLIVK